MADPVLASPSPAIAIIGNIYTENLGIEHLVKNVVANPFLRHLVLWGEDVEGHLPGNALLNLFANGMDRAGRIPGAQGARPVLKNITEREIDHFRRQIQITDLIGATSTAALAKALAPLGGEAAEPYEAGLAVELVKIQKATPARRLTLDPSGYFVIMVMQGQALPLRVEHYSNDGRLKHMIAGEDAASTCATVIEKKLVSRLDHAAYLGRELAKAEQSLTSGLRYRQDKAQGQLAVSS